MLLVGCLVSARGGCKGYLLKGETRSTRLPMLSVRARSLAAEFNKKPTKQKTLNCDGRKGVRAYGTLWGCSAEGWLFGRVIGPGK